jgi:ribonuclease R
MKQENIDAIWAYMKKTNAPKDAIETAAALNLDKQTIEAGLTALLNAGKLLKTRRGKYALPAHIGGAAGKLMGLRRGDAFFIPEDGGSDLFIREADRNGAMHGDAVVVKKLQQNNGYGRRSCGEVVSVTERAHSTVVGTVMRHNGGGVLVPEDPRLGEIVIAQAGLLNAQSKQLAVARITDYGDAQNPTRGEIVRILGEEGTIEASIAGILHEKGINEEFEKRTLIEAERVAQTVSEAEANAREDFRNLVSVTIDGADAKDFDDAISLVKTHGGHTLYVHIADVTHYVKPGTALESEGYERATSVYFPNRVLPMLPEALSNGICSLKANEDRLCLTCAMELDERGAVTSYRFARGVIVVDKRVVYEHANALFDEQDQPLMGQYEAVWPMLLEMKRLAQKLTHARQKRGALDFELAEPSFVFDEKRQVSDVRPSSRGISNIMIEEFMLLANECAAKYVKQKNLPALYRVHEDPDTSRVESFGLLLKALGQQGLKRGERVTPKALQGILHRVHGEPYEMAVSRVMLRTLQKAKYSETPTGHFGLALKDYCHFTSPIRRYPDITVHRAIIASLEGDFTEKAAEALHSLMPAQAAHTSERERASMEAERAIDSLYCAAYMQNKVGEQYSGIISGVAEFGVFVEIGGVIEGMIPIAALGEDVFSYDEVLYRITGRYTGARYTLGDPIEVVVAGADLARRRVDFAPVKAERPKTPATEKGAPKQGKTGKQKRSFAPKR